MSQATPRRVPLPLQLSGMPVKDLPGSPVSSAQCGLCCVGIQVKLRGKTCQIMSDQGGAREEKAGKRNLEKTAAAPLLTSPDLSSAPK